MIVQEQSNGQRVVTIPKDLSKALGISQGTEIDFTVVDDSKLEMEVR
jgi:antitoxin component of MazEF toxin-antitoxin module